MVKWRKFGEGLRGWGGDGGCWSAVEAVWYTSVYVRQRDGKLWIEIDWTEAGIATELLDAGVPKADIVLAFHHPSIRPYTDTEFAVA